MNFDHIIDSFAGKTVLVVGDVMVDEYISGDVHRISAEAPVPIVHATSKKHVLGGAANVANNIVSLGGKAILIGQAGEDDTREILEQLLRQKRIITKLLNTQQPTIKKTRVLAQTQQIVRIDWEEPAPADADAFDNALETVGGIDVIIVSDYDKGMITEHVIKRLKGMGKPIIVDPKPAHKHLYKDVFAINPNSIEAEAMALTGDIETTGANLLQELGAHVIITRGKEGASLFDKQSRQHTYFPTRAKEVYDVSGAGDTFVAAFSMSIAAGANLTESVMVANEAAGVVVGKPGTATITTEELKVPFLEYTNKINTRTTIESVSERLRHKGKKIVFTNGCFDILHTGHTKMLKEAKTLGDVLIVGVNTDESVRKLKGSGKPVNVLEDRMELLASMQYVDYVVPFGEDTPEELIKIIKPAVFVKGADYTIDTLKEADTVKALGGEIHLIPLTEGKSTTSIIKKIRNQVEQEPDSKY